MDQQTGRQAPPLTTGEEKRREDTGRQAPFSCKKRKEVSRGILSIFARNSVKSLALLSPVSCFYLVLSFFPTGRPT